MSSVAFILLLHNNSVSCRQTYVYGYYIIIIDVIIVIITHNIITRAASLKRSRHDYRMSRYVRASAETTTTKYPSLVHLVQHRSVVYDCMAVGTDIEKCATGNKRSWFYFLFFVLHSI